MTEHTTTLSGLCDRHNRDPRFNALVEMMVAHMISEKWAPDEVRDAAYVASIRFMQLKPVRRMIYENDLPQRY